MVGQEKEAKITRYTLSQADPRRVLRLTNLAQNVHSHTWDLSPFLDNTLMCLAHQNGSESALSQKGEVLKHVSNSQLIYLGQLPATIDVTFTKQPKTKPDN